MLEVTDLGVIEYAKAWEIQQRHFERLLARASEPEREPGVLLLCEHPHVYTLGRSGAQNNLLVSDDFLQSIGASYYRTDRGGDITYHGYGQLVGYPILDLQRSGSRELGLKEYIHLLEQSVIDTLADWEITAGRIEGATGVWLSDRQGERKICAIGVRASRFVTMHGFALNVTTDLKYFSYINPCGFTDKGVTSMERELSARNMQAPDMQQVKQAFTRHFIRLLSGE